MARTRTFNWIGGIVLDCMNNIKSDIKTNMDMYGRNASKKSVRSLRTRVEVEGSGFVGVIEGNESFTWMERGSGPSSGASMKGGIYQAIYLWMKAKHIQPFFKAKKKETAYRQSAGAIAKTILMQGTTLHRYDLFDDIYTSSINQNSEKLLDIAAELMFNATVETAFEK